MIISALCWLTMCFTIAKPKPVPPTSLLLAGSTLKNLSVTCGIFSFDMPIPWSLIVTKKFLCPDLVVIVIFLFFSLYFIPLSIRLLKTSIKRFLSPLIFTFFDSRSNWHSILFFFKISWWSSIECEIISFKFTFLA